MKSGVFVWSWNFLVAFALLSGSAGPEMKGDESIQSQYFLVSILAWQLWAAGVPIA